MAAAAAVAGECVFAAGLMGSVSYVALPIARLISVEVIEAFFTASRKRSGVAMVRIIAVVDVAVKAAMAVEPGASSNKDSAQKPVGAVVAVGGAIVRGIVEVAVRADRGNANVDGNLGLGVGCPKKHGNGKSWDSKDF
jgi:hypothetical protein